MNTFHKQYSSLCEMCSNALVERLEDAERIMKMDDFIEQKLINLLSEEPSLILMLKNKYVTENMWKICIQKEPRIFKYIQDPSIELCEFAVMEDGSNLKYIVRDHKDKLTNKIIWSAVINYPGAILHVPIGLRTDALKERAFNADPSLMKEFKNIRPEYIRQKIKENPGLIQYIQNPSEDIVYEALDKNPNICAYIKEFSPRMRELIKCKYPEMIELIPGLKEKIYGRDCERKWESQN